MSHAPIQPPAETPPDPSLLLTKSALAMHFGCSERQVDNLRPVMPPPIRLGTSPRWLRTSIVEWLAQLAQLAAADLARKKTLATTSREGHMETNSGRALKEAT